MLTISSGVRNISYPDEVVLFYLFVQTGISCNFLLTDFSLALKSNKLCVMFISSCIILLFIQILADPRIVRMI